MAKEKKTAKTRSLQANFETEDTYMHTKMNKMDKETHTFSVMRFLTARLLALADLETSTVHLFDIRSNKNLVSIRLRKGPHGICCIDNDRLVTTHDQQLSIIEYSPGTKRMSVTKEKEIKENARGIVEYDSKLYVTCTWPRPCIKVFSNDLTREYFRPTIDLPPTTYPLSIEVEKETLYVTDSESKKVLAYDKTGSQRSEYSFENEPTSLAKDKEGCIYVATSFERNIHKIENDGNILKDYMCFPEAETGLLAIARSQEARCFVCSDESGKNIIFHVAISDKQVHTLKITNPKAYFWVNTQKPLVREYTWPPSSDRKGFAKFCKTISQAFFTKKAKFTGISNLGNTG